MQPDPTAGPTSPEVAARPADAPDPALGPAGQPGGELVVQRADVDVVLAPSSPAPVEPRWRRSLAALRTQVPALARHPVVRAAAPWAGVGAGLLLGRLTGGAREPLRVEGVLHVEVVSHVVHHVVRHGGAPDRPALPPG